MVFEDAVAAHVQINADKIVGQAKTMAIDDLEDDRLQPGYIVRVSNKLVFVNNEYAILLTKDEATKLSGYEKNQNFVTAVTVSDNYFAVACANTGVKFYKLANDGLQLMFSLTPLSIANTNVIQITDMVYYEQQKALLILDEDTGVISMRISISNNRININNGTTLLKREGCQIMNIKDKTMHIVCGDIYQVSLASYPRITQKTLPHPNIKIRQIYVQGPLIAFVGRNIFKLMYLNRIVNYFQDQRMDKLIFNKNLFISANQGGIMVGQFTIIQPYVTCQTFNQRLIGSHPLIFKTVAQCDSNFLQMNGININSYGQISDDDKCIYTVEQTVYFWKTGKIMVLPILIMAIVFLVIAFGVLLIWIMKKLNIMRFQKQLAEYTVLGNTGDVQKHVQLVEQQPGSETGNNKSGASNKQNQDEQVQKKTEEIQMQNHDIE